MQADVRGEKARSCVYLFQPLPPYCFTYQYTRILESFPYVWSEIVGPIYTRFSRFGH